jgi:hypothetical protein
MRFVILSILKFYWVNCRCSVFSVQTEISTMEQNLVKVNSKFLIDS